MPVRVVFRMRSSLAFLGFFFLMACLTPRHLSENIARGKPTVQSSDYSNMSVSSLAVDGNYDPDFYSLSCTHTAHSDENPWWTVDLLNVYTIYQVVMYNRDEGQSRLDNVFVEGFLGDSFMCTNSLLCAYDPGPSGDVVTLNCTQETRARYIRLRKSSGILTLCEVEIFGEITSNQGPTTPLFPPLCSQKRIERIVGQKLTSSVDLGSASNRLDCLRLCQRRPSCSIFNYNNVTSTCSISVSLMNNANITSSHNWNLYFIC